MDTMPSRLTVVGIDVGGSRKGFHAVALQDGAYLSQRKSNQARELANWCTCDVGARIVAIDAPCRWSTDGRARPAERELMRQGIWCFSSTTREKAVAHPKDNFGWMLRGEELYQALQATHPLCNGLPNPQERFCFETFPHAITWYLRGGQASAKRKRIERAELLHSAGVQLPTPAGIDTIDAAICALTAHLVANGAECLSFGETQTGLIVVPASRSLNLPLRK
jgi:predicted nuclease with RNAse H fold